MAVKKTQKELFTEAIEVFKTANRPDLVTFAEERIAVLDKKTANRKPSKAQEATANLREELVATLTAEARPMSIADIKATIPDFADFNPQKITALLQPLVKSDKNPEGVVTRTMDKKTAYFQI